jgi:hypothetical protein
MKRRQYIGTVITALTTGAFAGCTGGGNNTGVEGGGTPTATTGGTQPTITFETQTTTGETVTVQSVSLPQGGYVAIHNVGDPRNIAAGTVIGVSDYLEAGTHENVPAGLFEVPGGNFSLDKLQNSQSLSAVAHQDTNGNQMFDFLTTTEDGPYTVSSTIVLDIAYVTVRSRPNATATTHTTRTAATPSLKRFIS